ncbi:MAG: colanic acid biosynthesis protein [Flavobacterium sp.]|nr:MAG: colanic acid biosynthesis protein [Flavobacterium sp.]
MNPKSLKIIIFDGSFKTTTFINRLAKGFSKNHEVFIVGFNNTLENKISKIKYIDLGSSQNLINLLWQSKWLATKRLFKTGNFNSFFKTLKNIFTLNKKQLQQDNFNTVLTFIKPDIIHVQWQSLLPWCENALLQQKYKFVISQRGYQSNVRPFVNKENFEYLEKWYPKFAGFHSVSKAIALEGDKIYSSDKKINKVVYSGFDFKILSFSERIIKSGPLQLLSVGRPHWIKGYSNALQTCKILKEKQIEFNYTIIGTSKRNEELLYLINDLGLQENVSLLPKMTQEEIYHKMKKASALLFPSIMEGMPNVVVEAMALGLPVISTECGGVSELIQPNKTGWLVPSRNPEALANAIIDFTKTPNFKIEEIRLVARQKVEEQHSVEKMVNGMESLYWEVIS